MIKPKSLVVTGGTLLFLLVLSSYSVTSEPKPKVLVNNGFSKSLLYEDNLEKPISSISEVPSASHKKHEITLSDDHGIEIINAETGNVVRKLKFQKPVYCPVVIDKEKNGNLELLATGGGYADVGLFGLDGKSVWIYQPEGPQGNPPRTIKAGDLNGDGILEFYAATSDGLDQLDLNGKRNWRESGWVDDLDIYNPGGGKLPLVVSNIMNPVRGSKPHRKIQFRNYYGKLVNEFSPKKDRFLNIKNCEWPIPGHVLVNYGAAFSIYDFNGKLIFQYQPWKFTIFDIDCCAVQFNSDLLPYLAVIVHPSGTIGVSNLSIFSPKGQLVYQEILKYHGYLSKTLNDSSGNEVLLVGSGWDAWRYSLK